MTLNLHRSRLLVEVVAGYAQLKLKKNMRSLGQVQKQIFEMPTGGAAIMRNGENLLYLEKNNA
jgi:hypothetical protein